MTWQDEAWQAFEDLGEPKPLPLVHKIKPLNLNGVQMPALSCR